MGLAADREQAGDESWIERAAALWALAGGCLLLAITLVTTLNAGAFVLDRISRPFGQTVEGLPGYEEFVRLVISGAVLMVLPYGQVRRGHVAVDLFVRALPMGVRSGLDRLWLAAMAVAALFLAYWMILGLLETRADGTSSRILGWPEWPIYLPGIVSLGLWALVAGRQCWAGPRREETARGAADHGA